MYQITGFILGELRGMWRFRWYALGVSWLVVVIGSIVVLTMPDRYRVEAALRMNMDSVLQPLLADLAVDPDIRGHMSLIVATVLSHENLVDIAGDNNLLRDARNKAEQQQRLDRLRSQIAIRDTNRGQVYRISYAHSDPGTARGVVQSTLDRLLENARGATMSDASAAIGFLEREVATYEQRLQQAEQRLASFKRDNVGRVPGQRGGFYKELSRLDERISTLVSDRRTARRRAVNLEEQLQRMRAGQAPVEVADTRVTALDASIRRSEAQLDELLMRYTDEHPDVTGLEGRIERQKQRRKALARATNNDRANRNLQTSPVYQEFQRRYNETRAEIASIGTRLKEERQRRDKLMAAADEMTEVETRFRDLTRNYENTQRRYQQLLSRLRNAETTAQADRSGDQMRLHLIEPPRTPTRAEGPPRLAYLFALLPMGLGAGGGVGYMLHQLFPVFRTPFQLAELTGRPVLGSVSLVMTRRQRATKLVMGFVFAAAVLVLVASVAVVASFEGVAIELLKQLPWRFAL